MKKVAPSNVLETELLGGASPASCASRGRCTCSPLWDFQTIFLVKRAAPGSAQTIIFVSIQRLPKASKLLSFFLSCWSLRSCRALAQYPDGSSVVDVHGHRPTVHGLRSRLPANARSPCPLPAVASYAVLCFASCLFRMCRYRTFRRHPPLAWPNTVFGCAKHTK